MAKLQSLPFPNQLRLSRQYGMSTETIPCCQGQQWEDLLWSEAWGTFCGATLFLTHWFSTNGAYIKPVMGLTWNSINPNMSRRTSSSIKNLSLHHRSPLVCTASKAGDVILRASHTASRWSQRASGKWLFLKHIKRFSDPCVPDNPLYSSLTVQRQITSQVPAWKEAEAKLRELYQFCEVLPYRGFFSFSYRLHPLRQQATHSNRTLTTRTAWNKHKLTTPPNGNSCYQKSFICYTTLHNSHSTGEQAC